MTNFSSSNSPAEFSIFCSILELPGELLGFRMDIEVLSCFVFKFRQRNFQLHLKGTMFIFQKCVQNSFPKMWYLCLSWMLYRHLIFVTVAMYCVSCNRSQRERLVERYLFECGVLSLGERENQMSTKIVRCGLSPHQWAFIVFQNALLLVRVNGNKEQLSAPNWSVE